ncbi:amidohydrolase [Glutamicibacter endophyticus]|uniref:amidohydrolase n=1 Tax=Glutamicibacter endophyticus TaxID=1522174 RepID=UPI003AF16E2C
MKLDAIYRNAQIRTLDAARPHAQSVGVFAGRVIGFDEELDSASAEEEIDLAGAPVLPGFNDAHNHLSITGARLAGLDLRPRTVADLDELYAAVARHARTLGPDDWVRGSGYDQNFLDGHPSAEHLDRVAGGRPVFLQHVSEHMAVANTRAFELAGYPDRHGVPRIDGGHVARDEQGRATGLLQERALEIIYDLVRPMRQDDLLHHLRLGGQQALSYGITSLTEPGSGAPAMIGSTPVDFHVYQRAIEERIALPRVTLMPYCTTLHQIQGLREGEYLGLDLGMRTGLGDEKLRIGPVKILSDGSFIGRSAAMHRCYHGEPENFGFLQFEPGELHRMIRLAHDSGWTVATHAIGDAAIDHVLDGFAAAQRATPRPGARHRIEHFALSSPAQVRRAAGLGLVAVPQGTFISDFGDGMMDAVDGERSGWIYRMKSLLQAGLELPGSTDAPVADANPLASIHDMVNRTTASGRLLGASERLTVAEAVRAYTYGSAYAAGEEHLKGTLRRGQLADFVTLSEDLFAVDPRRIRDLEVTGTYLGGRRAYAS